MTPTLWILMLVLLAIGEAWIIHRLWFALQEERAKLKRIGDIAKPDKPKPVVKVVEKPNFWKVHGGHK